MTTTNKISPQAAANAPVSQSENLRPRDAALYLRVSASLLAKLRMRDKRDCGPRFIKISGCILYRRSDLDDWLERNAIEGIH